MINVFLGYACNFKCGYCLQEPLHAQAKRKRLDPQIFIDRVLPWVIDQKIDEIAYWGGEPFLYWEQIKAIHEAFRRAGHRFRFIKLATNGSLLDEEKVATLNDWGAYVIVSQHGAFGQPNWDMVARLQNSSLSFLFAHGTLVAWPWLNQLELLERRYERPFFGYMHWVRATDGCRPDFYLTHADLDDHVPHLEALARARLHGNRHAYDLWQAHLEDWRRNLRPGEEAPVMCFGRHQIDVDLEGNRYGCHHTVNEAMRVGTLWRDPETHAERAAMQRVRRFVDSAACRACPIKTWCRGNCHLSRTHDVDCRLSKEKHRILAWLDREERGPNAQNLITV